MSYTTTLADLDRHNACLPGMDLLHDALGRGFPPDRPFPHAAILRSNGALDAIWAIRTLPLPDRRALIRAIARPIIERTPADDDSYLLDSTELGDRFFRAVVSDGPVPRDLLREIFAAHAPQHAYTLLALALARANAHALWLAATGLADKTLLSGSFNRELRDILEQ